MRPHWFCSLSVSPKSRCFISPRECDLSFEKGVGVGEGGILQSPGATSSGSDQGDHIRDGGGARGLLVN